MQFHFDSLLHLVFTFVPPALQLRSIRHECHYRFVVLLTSPLPDTIQTDNRSHYTLSNGHQNSRRRLSNGNEREKVLLEISEETKLFEMYKTKFKSTKKKMQLSAQCLNSNTNANHF